MPAFLGGLSSPYYAGLSLGHRRDGYDLSLAPAGRRAEIRRGPVSFVIPNALLHRVGDAPTLAASNLCSMIADGVRRGDRAGDALPLAGGDAASQARREETKESLEQAHTR